MSVYDIDYFKMLRYNAIRKIRGESMTLSEKQRQYQKKYDKNNLRGFTVTLKIKEYELFDKYCKQHNISKSKMVKSRIVDIIKQEND